MSVLLSGAVSGTTVENGGRLFVDFDGTASATTILSGGEEDVAGTDVGAVVSSGGIHDISGTASGATVDGIELVEYGGSAVSAVIDSGGVEYVSNGGTTVDVTINGGKVELQPGAIASGSITFTGLGGQLIIDDTVMPANTISGFVAGDSFDLTGVAFDSGGTAIVLSGNILEITESGSSYDLQLDPLQDFSTHTFQLRNDGFGDTLVIEDNTPCYCRGTRILTPDGELPVEDLKIGDKVVTASGKAQSIRWIGRRAYDGRFITGNRQVLPIRIDAGAFCPGIPSRELWVSPGHAMYLAGVLIQAEFLVNGMTIVQTDKVDEVEYFHIELDAHDIVYAEGALAETFTDCDNRLMFRNGAEYAALYPDDRRPSWAFCAPRLDAEDERLFPIRAALVARAEALGHRFEQDPDLHLLVDGKVLRPVSNIGDVCRFEIPAGAQAVWLASRSMAPAEVVPESRDLRKLGIPVERILMFDADMSIETWHSHAALSEGFHEDEETHRWTDGLGRLPAQWIGNFAGAFTLELRLFPSELRYRVAPVVREIAEVEVAAPKKKKRPAARRKRA